MSTGRHEEEVARLQAAAAETAERLREEGSRAVAEARRTAAEEAAAAAARAAAAAEAMKEAHGRKVAGLRGEIGQLQSTMASMQSELDGLKTANAQTMVRHSLPLSTSLEWAVFRLDDDLANDRPQRELSGRRLALNWTPYIYMPFDRESR